MPVQDGIAMDAVEEGGQLVGRELVVAKPDLKAFVGNRVEHGS